MMLNIISCLIGHLYNFEELPMYHIVLSALVFSLTGKVLQYIVTSFVHLVTEQDLASHGNRFIQDINQSVIIHIIKVLILLSSRLQ